MSTERIERMCVSCGGPCTGACWKKTIAWALLLPAVAGALFLVALFATELKAYQFVGKDVPGELLTIAVSGEGEGFAIPDIAEVSFSITNEAKDVASARKLVDEKMKTIQSFIEQSGVEKKDIKTTAYNVNPKYEWKQERMVPCNQFGCPPNPGRQVLTGYEVTQSVAVKIRKIENAGLILGGISDKGASFVSGLNFKLDDEDAVKQKARNQAIAKAKTKAQELAKELGVTLVRITSFSEDGNYPIYNQNFGARLEKTMGADAALAPANIPMGENTYTSSVTIVYEVK